MKEKFERSTKKVWSVDGNRAVLLRFFPSLILLFAGISKCRQLSLRHAACPRFSRFQLVGTAQSPLWGVKSVACGDRLPNNCQEQAVKNEVKESFRNHSATRTCCLAPSIIRSINSIGMR